MISNYTLEQAEEFFAEVAAQPSPRLIKTHHPFQLLPPALLDTCKVQCHCPSSEPTKVFTVQTNEAYQNSTYENTELVM